MNGIIAITTAIILLLTGCDSQPTAAIENTAYKWEKAFMDRDYRAEQGLLYKPGSYEVNKTAIKENSGLKENDIEYQIYYDKDYGWYYVLTDYVNPQQGNEVQHNLLIRKKDGSWKIDINRSLELDREKIQDKYKQVSCINCTK